MRILALAAFCFVIMQPCQAQTTGTDVISDKVYTIDSDASEFTVFAYRGGLFGRFGHDHTIAVRQFSGTVSLAEGDIGRSELNVTAKSASLVPLDDVDGRQGEAGDCCHHARKCVGSSRLS